MSHGNDIIARTEQAVTEKPSYEEQVRFLLLVQRLLNEGMVTASYKYALLLALADIAVERGDDSGGGLVVTIAEIARKYIAYYWRHSAPYYAAPNQEGVILKQNTDRQAAVVTAVAEARSAYGTLAALERDGPAFRRLSRRIAEYVLKQPLWRLQRTGGGVLDFLYRNRELDSRVQEIELRPGVAYCLRRFHVLITEMVRSAWLAYVRRINGPQIGVTSDLGEFLFGSERADLSGIRETLNGIQAGQCFYCARGLSSTGELDHFIPWSLYPVDLGHNFVIAHSSYNSAKGAMLAAEAHLRQWSLRNLEFGRRIAESCDRARVIHDLQASQQIAAWAYEQVETVGGSLWVTRGEMVPISGLWRQAFAASPS